MLKIVRGESHMENLESLLEKIWRILSKSGKNPYSIPVREYAIALKRESPQLQYAQYSMFAKLLFKRLRLLNTGFIACPLQLEWFAKSFISVTNPERIFVPYATGLEGVFLKTSQNIDYQFVNEDCADAATLFADLNIVAKIPENGNYDLIVSTLPLLPMNSRSISCQVVEKCSRILSENGYCIFPFLKTITNQSSEKWLYSLAKNRLYCNAVIDLPIGAFAPFSMAEGVLVVFSRKKTEERFVGLLSEESLTDKIVDNFLNNRISTSGPKLGVYVVGDVRSYSDYLNVSRIKDKAKALKKAYNGRILQIKDIGRIFLPNKNHEFNECDNSIYIPKLGNSPVVTDIADFHIKAQNYFQVVVDTDVVLPRFLAFFLNTEEGIAVRQLSYRGTTIKAFNTRYLGELVFPCPTIKLQSEYLKTYDQLEVLRVDVESLKDRLQKAPASYRIILQEIRDINNTGDKFSQWIESLPYPLATILKRYSVAEEASKRQEILFYLYEAYAIFVATILSAALDKNIVDCSKLKDIDPAYYEKASFGNWVKMDRALSNTFLKLVNGSVSDRQIVLQCFKTSDENLINLLCNKNICNILESASKYRNNWKGHSGISSEAIYKEHADILESMLHKLQENIKDLYERIRLVKPISLSFTNGVFSNKVEVLTGSNSIFKKDTIEGLYPLDNSKLYLQIIDTGEMMALPPYFILKNSPSNIKNACYFYSRVEKESTKYISYHYDGKPEDIEAGTIAYNHIKELLSN